LLLLQQERHAELGDVLNAALLPHNTHPRSFLCASPCFDCERCTLLLLLLLQQQEWHTELNDILHALIPNDTNLTTLTLCLTLLPR
jgi:hypothetical protein